MIKRTITLNANKRIKDLTKESADRQRQMLALAKLLECMSVIVGKLESDLRSDTSANGKIFDAAKHTADLLECVYQFEILEDFYGRILLCK